MPFVQCPHCAKTCSTRLDECPKCHTSLAQAKVANTHSDTTAIPRVASAFDNVPSAFEPVTVHAPQPAPRPIAQPTCGGATGPMTQPAQPVNPQPVVNPYHTATVPPVVPTAAAPQAAGFCGNCGTPLAAGAKFCGACGARVNATVATPPPPPPVASPYNPQGGSVPPPPPGYNPYR